MAKSSKRKAKPGRTQRNNAYKLEGRRERNKAYKLLKTIIHQPENKQALTAYEKLPDNHKKAASKRINDNEIMKELLCSS